MKNAKKSLALLLALVMIFGLGTMGASAALKDAADINPAYSEAVNVMSGMGILIGDENGVFNPKGNVTRAQAAKMIAYMMLGKDAAERLPAKAMFNDVKVTDWSAKYVYFLANLKIINGYGDGNFGPNDSVTGTQLAKMLLAAVGYGQIGEFVGVGWDVNVFDYAFRNNLFNKTEATEYDIAATREEAALYVFNTMTTIDLVAYSKDEGYVYKNGVQQTYAATKYNYVKIPGIITATQVGKNKYTTFTYNSTYGPATLTLNIDANSSLVGHKVNVIFNSNAEKDSDNTYYNAYYIEDLSKEVSISFMKTFKAVYNELGGTKADYSNNFTYWLNNVDVTDKNPNFTTNVYSMTYIADQAAKMPLVSPDLFDEPSGSFILDDAGKIIGFKKASYTFQKVRAITTTAGSESITLSSGLELKNNATEDVVVEYDGIAKGDYVSVTQTGEMYTLVKATVVKDVKVTSKDSRNTLNGQYYYSSAFITGEDGSNPDVGGIYDLYLDKNGSYALAVKVSSGVNNVAFVSYLRWTKTTGATGSYSCYANCVLPDGSVVEYLITPNQYQALDGPSVASGANWIPDEAEGVTPVETLYEYSLGTDVTYYNRQVVATFVTGATSKIATSNQQLESNYRVLANDLSGNALAGNYLLASDVEYVFVETNLDQATNPKTIVKVSKTKPSATSGPYDIYYYPVRVGNSNTYEVSRVFIASADQTTSVTSLIYSSVNDTARPSNIGHTELNADGLKDSYLHTFIDKDYVTNIKIPVSEFDANKVTIIGRFGPADYLAPGFYSYTISPEGYYDITLYNGEAQGDKNVVVNNQRLTSLYSGMISTIKDDDSEGVTDLRAGDAAIVDFSGWNITSMDQLYDLFNEKNGNAPKYTIRVSCWSYMYEEYVGTDKAVTNTLYITDIIKN